MIPPRPWSKYRLVAVGLIYLLVAIALDGCLTAPPPRVDPSVPDADPGAPDAAPGAGCERFADAAGFVLCAEDAGSCGFFYDGPEENCIAVCGGSACLASYDADTAAPCVQQSEDEACLVARLNQICVCAD